MLAVELCADNNPDGLFPLWPGGHDVNHFQKLFECGLVRPQHTSKRRRPSQVSWGPEELAAFLGVVDIWLSLCMVEF